MPGGYIYVTTALIRNMNTRAELAGVMGHEVGHIAAYHGAKAMQTNLGLSLLSQLVLGEGSAAQQVLEYTVGTYLNTAHSQDQELEADELGVTYASESGYNPWGIVDFFGFIEQISGTGDPLSNLLSSHPAPQDRIADSTRQINALNISKQDPNYVYDDQGSSVSFAQIKQRVIDGTASP